MEVHSGPLIKEKVMDLIFVILIMWLGIQVHWIRKDIRALKDRLGIKEIK